MRKPHRVLITGAGGPAAISFMKAVKGFDVELFVADMDAYAAGLYLTDEDHRMLVPAGAHSGFVDCVHQYCVDHKIDVLVPTVDSELLPVARARARFERAGVRLLLASEQTLVTCLDKKVLLDHCRETVEVPRYAVFDSSFDAHDWQFPVIVKPRSGSGSRGVRLIGSQSELASVPRGAHLLVQEFLPGDEYSVDTLAASTGEVVATVPRLRMKVDSGVAVTSRTLHDPRLEASARAVAQAIGLTFTANIQFRRNVSGAPALLEVNARFPGTMPLTVKSGVNMPLISLRDVLGEEIPAGRLDFKDLAMVRYWEERYVDPAAIALLAASAPPRNDAPGDLNAGSHASPPVSR